MWNKIKELVGYRKEAKHVTIRPVRDSDGKPAKHLEVAERKILTYEGWGKKKEVK